MAWPPTLVELKVDLKVAPDDPTYDRDDDALQMVLDASVAFVERVRPAFNYAGDLGSTDPDPTPDLILGTLRLASRWHTRRRSPDGLIDMAEIGSTRVTSYDTDIDRLLKIGKFRGPVFA